MHTGRELRIVQEEAAGHRVAVQEGVARILEQEKEHHTAVVGHKVEGAAHRMRPAGEVVRHMRLAVGEERRMHLAELVEGVARRRHLAGEEADSTGRPEEHRTVAEAERRRHTEVVGTEHRKELAGAGLRIAHEPEVAAIARHTGPEAVADRVADNTDLDPAEVERRRAVVREVFVGSRNFHPAEEGVLFAKVSVSFVSPINQCQGRCSKRNDCGVNSRP